MDRADNLPDGAIVSAGAEAPGNIEKGPTDVDHIEQMKSEADNMVYDNVDEEPELHARTFIAIAALFVISVVQIFALQGPPAVLSYIVEDLDGSEVETWIPNALASPQAVLGPVISSVADTFQIRKSLIVLFTLISFIGAAIAPGSTDIYRLIAAQTLIGMGFVITPLSYAIPSEILPRRWRPIAQAIINIGSGLGAIAGILSIGGLTKANPEKGWTTFYWIQMGLWGFSVVGILVAYRPPKRHTRYDHLSFFQKLRQLDIAGSVLLTIGLTTFLAGLNLGGGLYSWTNARVLAPLIVGIVGLIAFCLYEWKGTKTGILHHELFQGNQTGRMFSICLALISVEGILLFAFAIFYPNLTGKLFETDPFLIVLREVPFWLCVAISTVFWGFCSSKFRDIRFTLFAGYIVFTAGMVGMATVQPGHSTNFVVFSGLLGIGFGAPLILIIAAVQLCSPHHLIVTATAVVTSFRGMMASIFVAIFQAVATGRAKALLPTYLTESSLNAGLPSSSIPAFITALTSGNKTALAQVPGVNSGVIASGADAVQHVYADSFRLVFIIAASIGAAGCVACLFLGSLRQTMNYKVDAPVEDLHARRHR